MFIKRLKELRAKKGISQAALANHIGLSQQAIAKWETDKATPDPDMLVKLAAFFGVTTDYLIGHESAPSVASTDLKKLGRYINKLIDDAHNAEKFAPSEGGLLNETIVAQYIGISVEELSALKEGAMENVDPRLLSRVADKLNGDYEIMMRLSGQESNPKIQGLDLRPLKFIPILGYVPAGELNLCHEVNMGTLAVLADSPADFALIVRGDSMIEAGILDGNVVAIVKQNAAENGKTVVVRVDGEVTLKKIYKTDHGVILQPMNSKMSPIIVDQKHDIEIIGIAIESYSIKKL